MVSIAQQDQTLQIGGAAVGPMPQVVGVAAAGEDLAAGKAAVLVAEAGADHAPGAALVEQAAELVEHADAQVGVTPELPELGAEHGPAVDGCPGPARRGGASRQRGISTPFDRGQSYANNFFALTPSAVRALLSSVGFTVTATYTSPSGVLRHVFLAELERTQSAA